MRWTSGVLLLALVAVSGGCTLTDLVAVVSGRDAGTAESETDAGPGDSGTDAGTPVDSYAEYCARPGPAWIVDPVLGGEACGGHLAARAFKRALCSTEGIAASASFVTAAPGSSPAVPASVWTGGYFHATDGVVLGGSLQVDGTEGLLINGSLSTSGDLLIGGTLGYKSTPLSGAVSVKGDAEVAGDVFLKTLTVGGTLTQPDGGVLSVTDGFSDAQLQHGAVGPFTPVCPTSPLEDITTLVSRNSGVSHDSLLPGFTPTMLEDFTEARRTVTLPCGRFYLSRITGAGSVQFDVQGRSALFVGGDVTVGGFEVTLEPGAQLDLFIAGSLTAQQRLVLASTSTPSNLRVYLQQALAVPKDHTLSAHLYAPNALLEMNDDLAVSGSLFVRRLTTAGTFSLDYAPDILQLEATCAPPG